MPEFAPLVGSDVARAKLDVHLDPSGASVTVPDSTAGVRQLVRRLEPGAVIALEASDGTGAALPKAWRPPA